ncbi:hypothetical protein [Streptomyces sp. NPDC001750]|uniref:hypothetical protein n=1 Tax=Streptomyces sp. NPDC001750 TaxID=3364607 RepID=UPI003697F957
MTINLFKKRNTTTNEAPPPAPEQDQDQEAGEQQEPAEETELREALRDLGEALRELGARLGQGSVWLCQRCGTGAAAWCRAGHRDDLEGMAAEYGVWLRGSVLLAAAYGAWRGVDAAPWVLAPASGVWVLASLYAKAPAEAEPAEEEGAAAADQPHPSETLTRDDVALLLDTVYTEGSGVHLAALAKHLTGAPFMGHPAAPWATRDVRALLARHEVRVRPGVRVPPVGGREGVHRDDFPPLPSPGPDAPVVGDVVAGQSNNNNMGNASTPYPFEVIDDPDNPAAHRVRHLRSPSSTAACIARLVRADGRATRAKTTKTPRQH